MATIGGWAFAGFSWLLALGWIWQALSWFLHVAEIPNLLNIPASLDSPESSGPPNLTVIVPACNEEAAIAATLRSLLGSEGIRLQIIAVDDRSTDQTGVIMDSISAEFSTIGTPHSLEILHIRNLPGGWLGKPHALAAAAEKAQANWLLFTDGDVLFAPGAAARAMRYARAEAADHVVLMPDWITQTIGEAAMHGALHALSTWTLRLWRVADPAARDFLGVGAFNLVRRTAYEEVGGFTALRMEVLEDLRLGWTLKRAGFRQRVALGRGLAAVRWSNGAWGVVRNLEKNLFALYRYRVSITLIACFGLVIQIVSPIAAIAIPGHSLPSVLARIAGLATYTAIAALYFASRKVTRIPPAYVLLYPFATVLFLFAMLRSMILTLARGGVTWRGTLYSLQELRQHSGTRW